MPGRTEPDAERGQRALSPTLIRRVRHAPELYGRDPAAADLVDRLRRHRVVTLTGPAGVGKTALAVEVAARAARATEAFDDGVWFCDLAPITDGTAVPLVVAEELGVAGIESASAARSVESALAPRRALLVLDNAEQVVSGCSVFVRRIVDACPRLTVLVTSRELLRLGDEHVTALEPLDLEVAAPTLFTARAVEHDPGFDAEYHDREIAAICAELDGLPLALELAAARLEALRIDEVLAGLEDRFRTLRSGRLAGAPDGRRRATLAGSIGWSYDLLSAGERHLFDRLSVFAGGFDVDGARAVMAGTGREREVEGLLGGLVDKSMVMVRPALRAGAPQRYEMLESLRHFGDRQLADRAERVEARTAHLDHVVDVVATVGAACVGTGWDAGLASLREERGNIRAAVGWAIDLKRGGDVDRILRDLFFVCRWSLESEPAAWAARAVERSGATGIEVGGPVHLHLAFARFLAGDHAAALDADLQALEPPSTPSDRAWARHDAAIELLYLGRTAEAAAMADQAVAEPPPRPVEQAMQQSAHAIFKLYAQQMRFEDADAMIGRCESIARAAGNPVAIGHVVYNRGLAHYGRGDVSAATEAFDEALDLARRHDIANLAGYVLTAAVYAPGTSGLLAARRALEHCREQGDLGNEFVVLEAVGINLAEMREFEPAAVVLGHLEVGGRRIASSASRREAAMSEIRLQRRAGAWSERGAAMSRHEVIEAALQAVDAVLATR